MEQALLYLLRKGYTLLLYGVKQGYQIVYLITACSEAYEVVCWSNAPYRLPEEVDMTMEEQMLVLLLRELIQQNYEIRVKHQ